VTNVDGEALPDPLEDALAELLWRSPADPAAAFEQLVAEHPLHAAALRTRWQAHRPAPASPSAPTDDRPRIPGYEIVRAIGQGGMGRVYLARQSQPVQRLVAIKVIKLGMDSERILARFELERQALAVMEHDGIAKIYDAGATDRGQPYFAMEFVDGRPITAYCADHRCSHRKRIALFQRVCAAVQHAHEKGVIHRDLKPDNVLVTPRDGEPVPKVIDFGLARAVDQQLVGQTLHTLDGQLLGTPEYMSPEQARADARHIDTRSDVYSLGIILYELLTGQLPFASRALQHLDLTEMQRVIRESEPPRPSSRVGELRGDLDWIVLAAIAKEPARRYSSAAALAADLQRHLDHQPVEAGPPSTTYRIGKFVRRNRLAVTAAALIAAALLAGLGLAFRFAVKASRESALRQTLDLVALPVRLEIARDEARRILPAWPANAARIDDWVARWESVTESRTALAELGDARAPAAETAEAIRRATADVDAFLAPRGELARMRRESAWARRIEQLTLDHPRAGATWSEARRTIARADGVTASASYAGAAIDLQPQWGLVPIGMNPASKLWEFYHLRSAFDVFDAFDGVDPATLPIPVHRADADPPGRIEIGPDTGIVFVLLPRGETTDGGEVAPFFIARYELTQGQWTRLGGGTNRSYLRGPDHPVERVTPADCERLLGAHGLDLPTDDQWHYADRAGAESARFRPDDPAAWEGYANVLDETGSALHTYLAGGFPFADGYAHHSPVGTFAPNPFGLHDTCGNVWEFARGATHILRLGGSYTSAPRNVAVRHLTAHPSFEDEFTGVRPVRAIRQ